jgi:ABC-2 type transport system ATP-binding protein
MTGRVMRARTPEADRLCGVLSQAGVAFRRLGPDEVAMDSVQPEVVGPILATNQIVLYELVPEGGDLESVFLTLTAGLGFGDPATTARTQPEPRPQPQPGAHA